MRIALLVAGHRFTGAAAVAEHWCRALQRVGVQAELFFRAEGNLQWRLKGCSWARPVLVKEKRPKDLLHNLRQIRAIAEDFDAVLSFLPHDHVLALMADLRRSIPLIRAFRHPNHLRADPFHAALARRCDAALLPFQTLEDRFHRFAPATPVESIPVGIEDRFRPRNLQGMGSPAGTPMLGMVGKMAAGRGFEDAIEILACLKQPCRLLLVGHGEAEDGLRKRAEELGLPDSINFVGKQEARLPELLNSMSLLLFTAPGSDWGHRVISEAQSCGIPVVAGAIPGVEDLLRDRQNGFIVRGGRSAMAAVCREVLSSKQLRRNIGEGALRSAADRSFEAIGTRLRIFLERVSGLS